MRLLLILALLTASGCATVSEYKQGCIDGVSGVADQAKGPFFADEMMVRYYCSMLESRRKVEHVREKP